MPKIEVFRKLKPMAAFAGLYLWSGAVYAAGSNMPWEAPLTAILESIEGPVARIIAVIIIILTGLTLAFGETGERAVRAFLGALHDAGLVPDPGSVDFVAPAIVRSA